MYFQIDGGDVRTTGNIYARDTGRQILSGIRGGESFNLSEGRYFYNYRATGSGVYQISLRDDAGEVLSGPESDTAPAEVDVFKFRVPA